MENTDKTKERLLGELVEMRQRIAELEQIEAEQVRTVEMLRGSEERYRLFFENNDAVILFVNPKNGEIIFANQAAVKFYGYGKEQFFGMSINQINTLPPEKIKEKMTEARKKKQNYFLFKHKLANGETRDVEIYQTKLFLTGKEIFSVIIHDITVRVQAEKSVRQYVNQLNALRKIDQAISSNFDLNATLSVLLEHLRAQLEIDAAIVLRYDETLQILSYSHGQGFRTTALKYTTLRLGQGYAGKAAQQRQAVFIPDLSQTETTFPETSVFKKEDFLAYYGIPLIVKGALVGVLEIFHRSPLNPSSEWISFLQTLAGQTAIAIDNATLFNDLQHSNMKLVQAYDATIEGWAHALELRDMETEGHSRRVVELTITMVEIMGSCDAKLLDVRRGALLHDIGKMAVPDAVLLKPGRFNATEWKVMRKHPSHAYQWLAEIEYLRPALDIPYCHHERWDGNGYPRGLRGEHIPLSARIFAVVDVWDALLSDRPYRKAWSREKTLSYIRAESGKHFDPKVVDVFLKHIENGGAARPI